MSLTLDLGDETVLQSLFDIYNLIQCDTATGYRAVRSSVQGTGPPDWSHARLHLACINLFIFYGIYLERPRTVRKSGGEMSITISCNTKKDRPRSRYLSDDHQK
eukprot:6206111-Pleurochrysis_carterae.AAC.1